MIGVGALRVEVDDFLDVLEGVGGQLVVGGELDMR